MLTGHEPLTLAAAVIAVVLVIDAKATLVSEIIEVESQMKLACER